MVGVLDRKMDLSSIIFKRPLAISHPGFPLYTGTGKSDKNQADAENLNPLAEKATFIWNSRIRNPVAVASTEALLLRWRDSIDRMDSEYLLHPGELDHQYLTMTSPVISGYVF